MRRHYRVRPRFWIAVMLVTGVAFGCGCIATFSGLSRGRAEMEQLVQQKNNLMEEMSQLRVDIEFAQTDEFVERMARSELGMIKPGEVSYVSSR